MTTLEEWLATLHLDGIDSTLMETAFTHSSYKGLGLNIEDNMAPRLKLLLAFFDVVTIQDICGEPGIYEGEWILDEIIRTLRGLEIKLQIHINRMKADKDFKIKDIPYLGIFDKY